MQNDANIHETDGGSVTEVLPGHTYFIQVGASIKVGSAVRIRNRLAAERKRHKKHVKVLAVVPAPLADPDKVRELFAGLVTRWGWMRADVELLYFIDQLKAEGGVAYVDPPVEKSLPPPLTPFDIVRRPLYQLRKGRRANDPIAHACHNLIEMTNNLELATDEGQKARLRKSMQWEVTRLERLRAA